MPVISPKAIVENPAGLAADVHVGPFAYIGPEVSIEAGTEVGNNVTILGRTHIGPHCRLFPGCVIGTRPAAPQDPPAGPGPAVECTLGAGNFVREHVCIEAGVDAAGGGTLIGENNLLMVGCCVCADAVLDGQGLFANFTRVGRQARIEKFVRTSGLTHIVDYATVGAYTFTTGFAGIDRDAPPYAIVQGLPFRVRSVNSENLRRCGFDAKAIETLKKAFRLIFTDSETQPPPGVLTKALRDFEGEHVRYLVESLQRSGASPVGRCRQAVGQAAK